MDETLKAFAEECDELLERLEAVLLNIEHNPSDQDKVHELFRIIHTIKGSAGLFGFKELVSFSHEVENLAMAVRDGAIQPNRELCDLMLCARDHLMVHVDLALEREELTSKESFDIAQSNLLERLNKYLGPSGINPSIENKQLLESNDSTQLDEAQQQFKTYGIFIHLNEDVLTFGTDPLAAILYLQELGEIASCHVETEDCLTLEAFDPEKMHLKFKILLKTLESIDVIENAFFFFEESGTITVTEVSSNQTNTPSVEPDKARANLIDTALADPDSQPNKSLAPNTPKANESIRVDVSKLGTLINLVGELVIANANTHLLAKNKDIDLLSEATENMLSLVENIRATTLSLRMIQIGNIFNRFKRVVREVSNDLEKDINLVITGGDTELDKKIVDKINDPLLHLIRNSIDHGIESPQIRQTQGKPTQGTVTLNAFHDSGNIIIEIIDDGKGLSKDKIIARAIENGLLKDDSLINDQEIYDLIFQPGFSTADQVTNLSGRGVGMDVVRRNIDALGGHIDIQSKVNCFTKFSIRLPLTLAIIDGFLFEAGNSSYVVPLDMVDECIEFKEASNANYLDSQFINLRGEIMPYVRLSDFFQLNKGINNNINVNAMIDSTDNVDNQTRESIIVIRSGKNKMGMVVEKLLGEHQTVIKPVGHIFRHLDWLSGATILGSGELAIIIDVPALIKQVTATQSGQDNEYQPRLIANS